MKRLWWYIYIFRGRETEHGDWVWRMRGYRSMGSDSNLFKRWSRLVFNSILFPINEFLLAVSLSMFRSKFYRLDISRYIPTLYLYIYFSIFYLYRTFFFFTGKKRNNNSLTDISFSNVTKKGIVLLNFNFSSLNIIINRACKCLLRLSSSSVEPSPNQSITSSIMKFILFLRKKKRKQTK